MEELSYSNSVSFIEETALVKRKSRRLPINFKIAKQDSQDYQLQFIGDKSRPQTLKAFKQIRWLKCLTKIIQTIWIVPNNFEQSQRLSYLQLLNNHHMSNVEIKKISQLKIFVEGLLFQYPHMGLQIWFKDESVLNKDFYQFYNYARQAKLKIQYIYFNNEDKNSKSYFKSRRNSSEWRFVAYGTDDIVELQRQISQRNALPNFVYPSQKNIANILKMGLNYINKQPLEQDFALKKFRELVRLKMGEIFLQEVENFITRYRNKQIKSILKQYSQETFFYKFINNSLRMWKQPTQIYYLQPFIKRFHQEIIQLYSKNEKYSNLYKNGKAVFYRGGLVQEIQIQLLKDNLGKFIRSLGFLSTSISQTIAKTFVKNALIIIKCYECDKDEKADLGFARIQNKHKNFDQQQILFNNLSIFRVESVIWDEKEARWQIQMVYGEVAQYLYLVENKIAKWPENIQKNQIMIKQQLQKEREGLEVKNQLDIFIKCGYHKAAIKYCKGKIQHLSNSPQYAQQKQQCKLELINVYIIFQEFEKAQEQLQKFKNKPREKAFLFHQLYAQAFEGLALKSYNQAQKKEYFRQAHNHYYNSLDELKYTRQYDKPDTQQSIKPIHRKKKQQQVFSDDQKKRKIAIIQILHSLSNVDYELKQFDDSKRFTLQSIQLMRELEHFFGPNSLPTYLLNLMHEKEGLYYLQSELDNKLSQIEPSFGLENSPSLIILKLQLIAYKCSDENDKKQTTIRKIYNNLKQLNNLFSKVQFNSSLKNQYFFLRAFILSTIEDQPKTQTREACLSYEIRSEDSSAQDGWILQQIGLINKSKKQLQQSLRIFQSLENQSSYKQTYFLMKVKAFDGLLQIQQKEAKNSRQDIDKLHVHLMMMNMDQNIELKNKYDHWYKILAHFYMSLDLEKVAQIISDFKSHNQNSLKLIYFQIKLLLKEGKFKEASSLKKRVQETSEIYYLDYHLQQLQQLILSGLESLKQGQNYEMMYQEQQIMHQVDEDESSYDQNEQIMIETRHQHKEVQDQNYRNQEQQRMYPVDFEDWRQYDQNEGMIETRHEDQDKSFIQKEEAIIMQMMMRGRRI